MYSGHHGVRTSEIPALRRPRQEDQALGQPGLHETYILFNSCQVIITSLNWMGKVNHVITSTIQPVCIQFCSKGLNALSKGPRLCLCKMGLDWIHPLRGCELLCDWLVGGWHTHMPMTSLALSTGEKAREPEMTQAGGRTAHLSW